MDIPIPTPAVNNRDGTFLHFLKELPVWCIIGVFVGVFLGVWQYSHDDFIPRILDGLVGALLTSLVSNRNRLPAVTATTQTGDIMSANAEKPVEEDK